LRDLLAARTQPVVAVALGLGGQIVDVEARRAIEHGAQALGELARAAALRRRQREVAGGGLQVAAMDAIEELPGRLARRLRRIVVGQRGGREGDHRQRHGEPGEETT
jgi:hypothetical protein